MERVLFGTTSDGQEVDGYVLRNKNGLEVRCISYGCRINRISVPAAGGGRANVSFGHNTMAANEDDTAFMGAIIGRYANRIAGASVELDGQTYALTKNDGPNYLHGSWHKRVFQSEPIGENSVSFTYISPDGEDGFPGEAFVSVTYTLTEENGLVTVYRVVPEKPTYINMTNHAYFNLADGGDILDHTLRLGCSTFLEAGEGLIPTGRVLEAGGAFDFSQPKAIGQDICADDPQLKLAGGYDHCFIIDREQPGLALAADLQHSATGRGLKVYTSQPGIQLYTGNALEGSGFPKHSALCLESQHYPDSPHQSEFPSTLYEAGQKYSHSTLWDFSW